MPMNVYSRIFTAFTIQYRKHNVVHQPQGIPGVDSSRHLNQCYLRRNLSAKGAVTRILAAEGR